MSVAVALATGALAAVVVLTLAVLRLRARLTSVEDRARRLEELVSAELEPALAAARVDARAAAAVARDAAIAAGVRTPAPRLPFEPVTGPVVRAVAFGASARRAIARVATVPWVPRRDHRRSA